MRALVPKNLDIWTGEALPRCHVWAELICQNSTTTYHRLHCLDNYYLSAVCIVLPEL